MSIAGGAIVVDGVIAGTAEITYGGAVVSTAYGNFRDDLDELVRAFNSKGAGKVIDDLPTGGKITGYTKHGTEQALGRDGGIGVSNKAITDAVNNPVKPPV